MGRPIFETELAFFIAHQDELVRRHRGKVLAIQGESVVGVYDTTIEAYLKIKEDNQLGNILN